jgi:hypothetical protein
MLPSAQSVLHAAWQVEMHASERPLPASRLHWLCRLCSPDVAAKSMTWNITGQHRPAVMPGYVGDIEFD